MSFYRVVYDGVDIYDPSIKNLILLNPVLKAEFGSAGSFDFVMPPDHVFYYNIVAVTGNIEVYEDDALVWFGRPMTIDIDFFNQKKVHCEGALAFFNDTIMMHGTMENVTTYEVLQRIVTEHNAMVSSADRQFVLSGTNVDYQSGQYREFNFETCLEALKSMVVGTDGGYLYVAKNTLGQNVLYWFKEPAFNCNQPVKFAVNLLDLNVSDNYEEIYTGVVVVGGIPDDEEDNVYTDVIWASDSTLQRFGHIVTKIDYDSTDTDVLEQAGEDFLDSVQFSNYCITCNSADLHPINGQYINFQIGQVVRCISEPHFVNTTFPIMELEIDLSTAEKTITLGKAGKQSLTQIERDVNTDELEKKIDNKITKNTKAIADTNDHLDNTDDRVTALEQGGGWTHQIDGVTYTSGTINFITVT